MKQGVCKNYNYCTIAQNNIIVDVSSSKNSFCKECGEPLILKKEKRKKNFLFKKVKRYGYCTNDVNCNLALNNKRIKIYTKEDTTCRECNTTLRIVDIERKTFKLFSFRNLFIVLILFIIYVVITSDSIDITENELYIYQNENNISKITLLTYKNVFAKKFRESNASILNNLSEKEKVIICNKVIDNIKEEDLKKLSDRYSNDIEEINQLVYWNEIKECNPNKIKF